MDGEISQVGGCRGCGYDLRGLDSSVCPECGRAFDPANAGTVGPIGTPLGCISRWAVAPTTGATGRLTTAVLILLLWQARYPADVRARAYSPACHWLWLALIVFWGLRLIAQVLAKLRLRDPAYRSRIWLPRTTLLLAMIVCVAQFASQDLVANAAIRLSRPAFARLASSATTKGATFSDWKWVGVYRIRFVRRTTWDPTTVIFNSSDAGACFFLDQACNDLRCESGFDGDELP